MTATLPPRGPKICLMSASGTSRPSDVGDWHIASFRCAAKLVVYWTNNGQRAALGLNG
jgi:hypothetical protein